MTKINSVKSNQGLLCHDGEIGYVQQFLCYFLRSQYRDNHRSEGLLA